MVDKKEGSGVVKDRRRLIVGECMVKWLGVLLVM